MYPNLQALMEAVNCQKYPERWTEIYDAAMRDYTENGSPYTDPAYYEALAERYGVLTRHLALFRQAAEEIGKSEALSRFLHLLCTALRDEAFVREDLKQFSAPQSPPESPCLAVDMLTGLALHSQMDRCYQTLCALGLPQTVISEVMSLPECGVEEYAKRHGGIPGYDLLQWFQLSIEGKLFRIKRLEFERAAVFKAPAIVFEHKNGERIALAHGAVLHASGYALGSKHYEDEEGSFSADVTESENAFCGNPFLPDGRVLRETVTLPKNEWKILLQGGDDVISVHIPPIGDFRPETVDESIDEAKKFFAAYFPSFRYKAFVCRSWLLDPKLEDMLLENSNIVRFGKRFTRFTMRSKGEDVFRFLFLKPNMEFSLEELPENTRLERAVKTHYQNGGAIYEPYGYFI